MNKMTSKKVTHWRTFWLISVLMVVLVGVAGIFAYSTIRGASESMTAELDRDLSSDAQHKVAAVAIELGGLRSNARALTDKDMFRLFCTELFLVNEKAAQRKEKDKDSVAASAKEEADLQSMRPIMRRQLRRFAEENGLQNVCVRDAHLNLLLTTEPAEDRITMPEVQKRALERVLDTGVSMVSSAHDSPNGLVINVLQPVFPPAYTDLPADRPVAVLMAHMPVTASLAPILGTAQGEGKEGKFRLLQWKDVSSPQLEEIAVLSGQLRPLAGWKTPYGEALPLERRPLSDDTPVYSLAMPVPDMPLLVAAEENAATAEGFFYQFRNAVLMGVGGFTLLLGLLLFLVWWLIVGRNERDVARHIQNLHSDVNKQRQILDGINKALADGVVLTDLKGTVLYANAAFAHMVRHSLESLPGLSTRAILSPEVADRILAQKDMVVSTGTTQTFEDTLVWQGRKMHLQAVCTPYLDENDALSGVVSVYRDTTTMVEAREADQRRVRQTIRVLMRAIEAVDPYLCGQSTHMGVLAVHLAVRMGLSQQEQDTLRTAATLSQIGMLRLPPDLLRKSGSLSVDERRLLETHVEHACTLLDGFDFGLPVQATICQMYEHMDGSGYPTGLRAQDIGLLSRILCVANVFCAILRPRSYRQAKDVEEALTILAVEPPRYDPAVVQALQDFLQTVQGQVFMHMLSSDDDVDGKGGQ